MILAGFLGACMAVLLEAHDTESVSSSGDFRAEDCRHFEILLGAGEIIGLEDAPRRTASSHRLDYNELPSSVT